MLKWLTAIIVVFVLGLLTVSYLYASSLRRAGLSEGMGHLQRTAREYAERGQITTATTRSGFPPTS